MADDCNFCGRFRKTPTPFHLPRHPTLLPWVNGVCPASADLSVLVGSADHSAAALKSRRQIFLRSSQCSWHWNKMNKIPECYPQTSFRGLPTWGLTFLSCFLIRKIMTSWQQVIGVHRHLPTYLDLRWGKKNKSRKAAESGASKAICSYLFQLYILSSKLQPNKNDLNSKFPSRTQVDSLSLVESSNSRLDLRSDSFDRNESVDILWLTFFYLELPATAGPLLTVHQRRFWIPHLPRTTEKNMIQYKITIEYHWRPLTVTDSVLFQSHVSTSIGYIRSCAVFQQGVGRVEAAGDGSEDQRRCSWGWRDVETC